MQTKKLLLATALPLCLLTSCALIIKGSRQNVVVTSEPKQANISIDGLNVGSTPFSAKLKRNRKHEIVVSLEGYTDYHITLTKKFNFWLLGNLVLGGILGIAIDAATGSMYSLTPNRWMQIW